MWMQNFPLPKEAEIPSSEFPGGVRNVLLKMDPLCDDMEYRYLVPNFMTNLDS